MSWFSFGSNDNKDSIKDKIRDLEIDLRSIEYDYYKACDELIEQKEKEIVYQREDGTIMRII